MYSKKTHMCNVLVCLLRPPSKNSPKTSKNSLLQEKRIFFPFPQSYCYRSYKVIEYNRKMPSSNHSLLIGIGEGTYEIIFIIMLMHLSL